MAREKSGMERVCPRCGRTSSEVPFIGALCRDCYVEVKGIARIPERIHYVFCKYCGRYKYQGGWNEPSGSVEETLRDYIMMVVTRKGRPTEAIEEFWVEDVRLDRPFTGPGIYNAIVRIGGRSGDVEAWEERVVTVKVDVGVCPECTNRITKRGYNAIVQIRSSDGRLSEGLRRRVDRFLARELSGVLQASIIGTEEHREGFDLLIADPSTARMIASKLRQAFMGKTVETWKLVGRRPDGSRKGRLTILVRLPDVEEGDVVSIGGRPHLILAQPSSGAPILVDLETGREYTPKPDQLWEKGFHRYEKPLEYRTLLLVSRTSRKIIFLDPEAGYDVREYPAGKVRVYVEDFEPGRYYRVLLVRDRAYVLDKAEEPV